MESPEDVPHHPCILDTGQALVEALEGVSEPAIVDSHAMQDGGVEVVKVNGVLDDVVAEINIALHNKVTAASVQ